jgi:hypothetical protein
MNSIPQHDVANGKGQSEFARAKPTKLSKLVAKKPAPSIPGGASATLTVELLISFYLMNDKQGPRPECLFFPL